MILKLFVFQYISPTMDEGILDGPPEHLTFAMDHDQQEQEKLDDLPPTAEEVKTKMVNMTADSDTRCLVVYDGSDLDCKVYKDAEEPGPPTNYGRFQKCELVREVKKTKKLPHVPEHWKVKTDEGE